MDLEKALQLQGRLPETTEIQEQRKAVVELRISVQAAGITLKEMILMERLVCRHENKERVTRYDPNYSSGHPGHAGMEVLEGWICLDCGQIITRPKGKPSEVCYLCGGKMRFDALVPGQGERWHVYVCENSPYHVYSCT